MEHRSYQRSRLLRNVVLHTDTNRLITGKMRELSGSGMYLTLPTGHALPPGETLRAAFMLGTRLHLAPVRVARRDGTGVGLAFLDEDPALRAAVLDYLGREGVAARRSRAA